MDQALFRSIIVIFNRPWPFRASFAAVHPSERYGDTGNGP
jgi:hypothetical protein